MSTLLDLRELGRDDIATAGGKVDSSGQKIDGNVFHVGLGFTWH